MYLGPTTTSCISCFARKQSDSTFPGVLTFNFAGTEVSLEAATQAAVSAQAKGEQFVKFGFIEITPKYIFDMISFAVREGWFLDEISDRGQDHNFDPDMPTPGAHWKAAGILRSVARDRSSMASSLRRSEDFVDRIAGYLVSFGANRVSARAETLARAMV